MLTSLILFFVLIMRWCSQVDGDLMSSESGDSELSAPGGGIDTTIVGRAAARRSSVTKVTKNPENVIASLPAEFFSPDFDPVQHQLRALATWDSAELMERFMSTIEETDTDKDMVLVKLAEMIETNYSELMECMRDVST